MQMISLWLQPWLQCSWHIHGYTVTLTSTLMGLQDWPPPASQSPYYAMGSPHVSALLILSMWKCSLCNHKVSQLLSSSVSSVPGHMVDVSYCIGTYLDIHPQYMPIKYFHIWHVYPIWWVNLFLNTYFQECEIGVAVDVIYISANMLGLYVHLAGWLCELYLQCGSYIPSVIYVKYVYSAPCLKVRPSVWHINIYIHTDRQTYIHTYMLHICWSHVRCQRPIWPIWLTYYLFWHMFGNNLWSQHCSWFCFWLNMQICWFYMPI